MVLKGDEAFHVSEDDSAFIAYANSDGWLIGNNGHL